MISAKISGTIGKVEYLILLHNGKNGQFGTMYKNGEFFHYSKWGDGERKLIDLCLQTTAGLKSQTSQTGSGFCSIHGRFELAENKFMFEQTV